jgi:hypothetical protein
VIWEIIALICGALGLTLTAICIYILAGWVVLGLLIGITLMAVAVILGLRPDKPV